MFGFLKGKDGKENLMAVVQLKALELNLSVEKYVSVVIKRGKKERHENVEDKILYSPLTEFDVDNK